MHSHIKKKKSNLSKWNKESLRCTWQKKETRSFLCLLWQSTKTDRRENSFYRLPTPRPLAPVNFPWNASPRRKREAHIGQKGDGRKGTGSREALPISSKALRTLVPTPDPLLRGPGVLAPVCQVPKQQLTFNSKLQTSSSKTVSNVKRQDRTGCLDYVYPISYTLLTKLKARICPWKLAEVGTKKQLWIQKCIHFNPVQITMFLHHVWWGLQVCLCPLQLRETRELVKLHWHAHKQRASLPHAAGKTPHNGNVFPFKNKNLNCKEVACSSLRKSLRLPL